MSNNKILLVKADFYQDIANMLTDSAKKILQETNYQIDEISVPGCFEIAGAISMAHKSGQYDGFIALGCVIRGETTHYDYVCSESANGINLLAINKQIPIGYGIITAENKEQAYVRADFKQKNVGGRAAKACLEMIKIRRRFCDEG